jgi:hypothetical protein
MANLEHLPLRVMCGRRLIDKSFLTLMQHWSGAVMCPASHDGFSVKG